MPLPDRISSAVTNHRLVNQTVEGATIVFEDRINRVAAYSILFVLLLGVFGPVLAPHDYSAINSAPDGSLLRLAPPLTGEYFLGTTERGEDVLSRIMVGARPTVITGILGGLFIISIGMTIGVTAGYIGGWYETLLMRFTDFVYGVPLIPFAIVLIVFMGVNYWTTILVIGVILWRGNARVLRAQVLQIKQRPYILAAKATGASTRRIVLRHILPNITSMIVLFFALGVGSAILVEANLAFIGVSDPFVPSWGIMVRNAYEANRIAEAWWWSIPPGLLISLTVLSTFLLGRSMEQLGGQSDEYTGGEV
ncbi:ABC transporter permease [Halorubrum trueperi]|uniref:ABC transporter permease n=1 Tax=Halorubrum trueperi TaxID=2004704 RepID=A0ABD5UH72_9EURY